MDHLSSVIGLQVGRHYGCHSIRDRCKQVVLGLNLEWDPRAANACGRARSVFGGLAGLVRRTSDLDGLHRSRRTGLCYRPLNPAASFCSTSLSGFTSAQIRGSPADQPRHRSRHLPRRQKTTAATPRFGGFRAFAMSCEPGRLHDRYSAPRQAKPTVRRMPCSQARGIAIAPPLRFTPR